MEGDQAQEWQDLTVPLDVIIRISQQWALVGGLLTLGPYVLLWGLPAMPDLAGLPAFLGKALLYAVAFLLVYLVSAVVHEGLHAAGMVLSGQVPWRAIRFHLRLQEGIAYVHTAVPMTVRAYQGVLVLPGIVQGVLPVLAGLALGSGWLTFYGYVMLVSSVGDFTVFRLMVGLDGRAWVRDHPSRVGCQVQAA